MATIAENLLELQQTKANIKTAIESKGQDLTDVPFTQYADKISAIQTGGGEDRLQLKCNTLKTLAHEFRDYKGTDFSILNGLDTSKVTDFSYMFYNCTGITDNVPVLNTSSATKFAYMFYNCSALKMFPEYDFSKVTDAQYMFYKCEALTGTITVNPMPLCSSLPYMFSNCSKINKIIFTDTSKIMSPDYLFSGCTSLETIENINLISMMFANTNMFSKCTNLKNLTIYNIKKNITIGSGTSYGTLLTLDSLIHTIKELWDLTGTSSQKLTMSTPSKELIANVYVKLVDVTGEMLAQDQYASNKKPCVVCESTDDGAMLITEYLTSKNWTLA